MVFEFVLHLLADVGEDCWFVWEVFSTRKLVERYEIGEVGLPVDTAISNPYGSRTDDFTNVAISQKFDAPKF